MTQRTNNTSSTRSIIMTVSSNSMTIKVEGRRMRISSVINQMARELGLPTKSDVRKAYTTWRTAEREGWLEKDASKLLRAECHVVWPHTKPGAKAIRKANSFASR